MNLNQVEVAKASGAGGMSLFVGAGGAITIAIVSDKTLSSSEASAIDELSGASTIPGCSTFGSGGSARSF